jgi:nucleotide-binding universal stress UspA family protein
MRPVLVAYDGSAAAHAAVVSAAGLFPTHRLLVVSIWEPGLALMVQSHADTMGMGYLPSETEVATVDRIQGEHAQTLAERGVQLAREHGATAEAIPIPDEAGVADTLEHLAEEHDVAAIVVGTRGHGGMRSRMLGSTSRRLVHRCHRPVMVVHAE